MSKIEKAIRKVVKDREFGADRADSANDASNAASSPISRQRAPAIIKIEPGQRFELDPAVLERNRIIHPGFQESALNSYKMLRTRVVQLIEDNNWQTIAIVSAKQGAGKTVTAINLAMTMAGYRHHHVYLLDLDLRKPDVAPDLGLPEDFVGLEDYLAGKTPINQVLWDIGIDGLTVAPSCNSVRDSSELITSGGMGSLFSTILSSVTNPVIILHLPPILSADDVLAVAPNIDGMLLVVAEGTTAREDLSRAMDLLRTTNVIGVVLNKSVSA
jgi:protein-tyrosine kinase